MNQIRFPPLATLAMILVGACLDSGDTVNSKQWDGVREIVNGVETIRNPPNPLLGSLHLDLAEELVLGDTINESSTFFFRISGKVDDQGQLYVWDPDSHRIQCFDSSGRFLRSIGQEGKGPGEFSDGFGLKYRVAGDGGVAVLDGGRIQLFDAEGRYLRPIPVPSTVRDFVAVDNGGYLWDHFSFATNPPTEQIVLTDSAGARLQVLEDHWSEKWQAEWVDRFQISHLASNLILAPWGSDGGVFGFPTTYRITLVGPSGDVTRVVDVLAVPQEIDSDIQRVVLEDVHSQVSGSSLQELEGEVYFPESWPFFDALLSDEGGNLLVQRDRPPSSEEPGRQLDLITPQGLYLFQLTSPVDQIQAFRNGFLYARRFDRTSNVSQLVRYRIRNWDEVLSAVAAHADFFVSEEAKENVTGGERD